MPQNKPMPGEIYRHFKNKNYQIVAVATHSETREPYVVYQALYGDYMTYIRPYDMFISEVDHKKYPQVTQKYRFAYIGSHNVTEAEMTSNPHREETTKQEPKKALFETAAQGSAAEKETERIIKKESSEAPTEKSSEAATEETVDSRFLAFLDADDFDKKYEIVSAMEEELTDHLINQMAASIDVIIDDGRLDDRIMELKKCIRMRARFEIGRGR